ncbi:hypothetical protein ACJ72_06708 [Emergomyces africanus]|uniref:Iron-sulfur cluster assembly factor IBA57 homolog, mitochondrial n=1 Tax=Emergomyces africanus TaxID=1955775 RepID=A0A1B7NQU2_9EURO|nr:hypothetical protein ACJ72_06708 [Emergomyces africanus]
MSQWSHYHHSTAFSEFLAYKTRVPVRGAILLNQDMDEVVLVKGWKKNANWSFPRGKINKDEKDLDCAIREVYEETGFDIRAAGLVKDEKKIKYIEIPMREQNMRLYVLRGVPADTVFEPRTRKEISKIEWYKLSELPTLKKNKQIETNGHNLSNKFYMVAPFLGPLKKWIAQQKRADLAVAQNLNPNTRPLSGESPLAEEDEGLSTNEPLQKEKTNEVQLPSDLPEVSLVDDPSAHLKRILNINNVSSLPEVSIENQLPHPDLSKGSELLALLRKASDVGADQAQRTTIAPPNQSVYPPKDLILQHAQHQAMPPPSHFSQASVPPHQNVGSITLGRGMSMNQSHFRNMPHPSPRQVGQYPSFHFPRPPGNPLHRHHHQQRQQPAHENVRQLPYPSLPASPGVPYSGNQPSTLPNPPKLPFRMPPMSSVPNQVPRFNTTLPQRNTPAPYQRTGDPDFAQELFPNLHAPSIPPASKLPPPKLTSHSLALLNFFKNDTVKKSALPKPELVSQPGAAHPPTNVQSQHQASLLELMKKPQAAPPTPGHAELAARPSPSFESTGLHVSNPVQSQPIAQTPRKPAKDTARTSATVSGPLNMPQFEAIAKPTPKKSANQPLGNTYRQEVKAPKGNFVILPRPPPTSKDVVNPQPTKPPPASSLKRNVKLSEITKPFQPKILRRPIKESLEASLPNATVTVSAFTLSEKDTVPDNPREKPVEVDYDRRPSQTASQKEALLSLFGKVPSPSAPLPSAPNQASPPAPKSPRRSAIISPLGLDSPQAGIPTARAPAPVSSRGSISPVGGSETRREAPTSPRDKAFLLGYLDNIAKVRQFSTFRPQHQQSVPSIPSSLPSLPPLSGYARLPTRALIAVTGKDSTKFLQGLVTQNLLTSRNTPVPKSGFYAAFLNAPGRVLHDVFIYPVPPNDSYNGTSDLAYLIEVDKNEVTNLMKHMRKHKLRSKLAFRAMDEGELNVFSLWNEEDAGLLTEYDLELENGKSPPFTCVDTRAPGFGFRFLAPEKVVNEQPIMPGERVDFATYNLRRILHGVPEGQGEIIRESALPMECNMDIMGGIDFHKGCYTGQELTIRTHHRGVVRKRILPVQLYDVGEPMPKTDTPAYSSDCKLTLPPAGSNIAKVSSRKGRSAGKFLSGVGNIGLALCRLEMMTDIAFTEESSQYSVDQEFKISWEADAEAGVEKAGELKVKALVPPWTRDFIVSGGAKKPTLPTPKSDEEVAEEFEKLDAKIKEMDRQRGE